MKKPICLMAAMLAMLAVSPKVATACGTTAECPSEAGPLRAGEKVYVATTDDDGSPGDAELVKVIAVQKDGAYAIKSADGSFYSNLNLEAFARLKGCIEDLCVGSRVVAVAPDAARVNEGAEVVGIGFNKTYTVKFDSDKAVGFGWKREDLAEIPKGVE